MKMMSKRAIALAAALAATSLAGCDDNLPTSTDVRVVFTSPEVNAVLTCADDLDRTTDGLLEVHVDALIQNQGAPLDGLRVELVIDEADKLSATVPVEGVLRFEAVPLALGDRVLVLSLIEDDSGTVVSTARRVLNAAIDPTDPSCDGAEPGGLVFVAPMGGAVLDETGDDDLSDDLQISVGLTAAGGAPVILTVNGETAGEASPVDGAVAFEGVTIPIGDGANVEAILRAVQGDIETEIAVTVAIDGCAIELSPEPIDGCWSDAQDADPDTDGVQVEFTATTNCGSVIFEHSGDAGEALDVVDGVATTTITLSPGDNSVAAIASTAGGLTGTATGDYQVGGDGPELTLDLEADDTRLRADLDDGGEQQWTISGVALGVTEGESVSITGFDDDVEAAVGPDGRLSFPVAVDYACPVTIQVSGTDACGADGASPEYTVCFDAVSPLLEIVDPLADAVLVDGNGATPGVQTAFSVRIGDVRPADVDYDIGIECGSGDDFNEYSIARRARSDAEDGVVIIAVDIRLDDGDYTCRATAAAVNNAPTTPVIDVRIDSAVLGFTIASPDPEAAPVCYGNDPSPSVSGIGAGLTAANAMLVAIVDGDESFEIALNAIGNDNYGIALDTGEGNFTVTVRGMSDRGAIGIAPAAPVPFIVDRTAPVLGLVSPAAGAELGLADDANNDLSDCVQTRVAVSLDDASTDAVCWSLNGGVEACGAADANGQFVSDQVSLRGGENTIAVRAVDCAGNETNAMFMVTTAGCGEDLRSLAISTPSDGGTLRAVQDVDPALDDCQIDVNAGGAGFDDGTEFIVCSTLGEADPRCAGGGAAVSVANCESGGGGAAQNLICRVTLPDGAHQLTVVSLEANAFSSEAIALSVDCTAPSVASLVLVEDDGDGCVNSAEAGDADENGAYAMTLRVTVDGIADGEAVTVRRLPEDEIVNAGVVNNGVASVDLALPEGEHSLYATGADAAGNELAGPDDALQLAVRVDARAPEPVLLGLVPDSCLNAAADANAGLADMQYGFSANAGGDAGEVLATTLTIDGEDAANMDAVDALIDFMPVDLSEGDHAVAITVTDACGNVGSVAGFDGDDADTFAVRVDTIAPAPALGGLADGQVLAAADDADPAADGLQVQIDVSFDGGTGPENGQDISVRAGAGLLATLGADGGDGPLQILVTLPGGDSALTASATDTCGNVGQSDAVNVSVAIDACASLITGFASNPASIGSADGVVIDDTIQITITGSVEPGCGGGTADLLVDGEIVASENVGGGNLSFADVILPEGANGLSLRVSVVDVSADSPVQTVVVDLTTPSVTVDTPAGLEPIVILDDADPETVGQQVVVGATVIEAAGTPRTVTLTLNGAIVAGPNAVDAGSPVAIDFGAVTLPPGEGPLEVCVTDMAGNRGCAAIQINLDAGAPGLVAPTATITDPRATRVRLDFVAPGEDGADGGRVVRYRIRRADQPIVTEDDWRAAEFILASGATVDPGENERIALVEMLGLNTVHHVAVRGVDENDLEGAFTSVAVDLRLSTRSFDIDAPFAGDVFFNAGSLVIGAGDLDGDGLGDFLMFGNQQTGEAAAAVVFGGEGADAEQVNLVLDPGTSFAATGAGALGDVNGDGVDDIALLGYSAAFDASRVALYFGGARADVATPDAIITLPGRLTNFVTGVGNFTGGLGDGFNDVFIGGSPGGGGTTAFVVHGRANWPATLDAVNALDGVTQLTIPEDHAGVFAAGIGDIDGDGNDDLALGGGGNFDVTYVFYGARELPLLPVENVRRVALVNPCIDPSTSFGSWFAGGQDLTGDGTPDFMVGARGHKRVAVFDQDLASVDCVGRTEVQFGVNFDIAGDLNGDGSLDLIVTHRDNLGRPNDAMAFYNDGTGHFGGDQLPRLPDVLFTETLRPRLGAAGLGDFNGDGLDDVVTIYKVQDGPLRAIVHF
ncbi:MAG: hypothetical protein ACI9U2_000458 [Bradymonadia bacterium]|jgi:hypothetical protein